MNRLAQRIARAIKTDGPLSIATYMTLALHDPEDGFYAAHEPIGAEGAFITAPETSQMFGELLGLWCAQVWSNQANARAARLVDLGPGRATLIEDMLRAARVVPEFLGALELVLVEASAALEVYQRKRLEHAPVEMRWVRQWSEIAHDRPVLVLANEFFDTLPTRQFVMTDRGWCERMVTINSEGQLAFALGPLPSPLAVPTARGTAEAGAVYEMSAAAEALSEDLGRAVAEHAGTALIIDYGHTGNGFGDTLQAVACHKVVDVLAAPGEADLSAHVDFSALARSAERGGARVHGPISQGDFLRALGIQTRAARLARDNPQHADAIAATVHRLVDAREMGTLFKVLAIAPRDAPPLPGF